MKNVVFILADCLFFEGRSLELVLLLRFVISGFFYMIPLEHISMGMYKECWHLSIGRLK